MQNTREGRASSSSYPPSSSDRAAPSASARATRRSAARASQTAAIAIANTIAYVSELIDPIRIFLGLTRQNPMSQSFRYLLWGEGETGYEVYKILLAYWDWTPEDDVRPLIFLMSE